VFSCFSLSSTHHYRIPVYANKLTSTSALAVQDYSKLSICDESVGVAPDESIGGKWHRAVAALHGDAYRTSTLQVEAGIDVYCGNLCTVLTETNRVDAVQRDFFYNFVLDRLPGAFVYEDEYVSAFCIVFYMLLSLL